MLSAGADDSLGGRRSNYQVDLKAGIMHAIMNIFLFSK